MSFCFFNVGLSLFARLTRGRGKKKKNSKLTMSTSIDDGLPTLPSPAA